MHHICCREVVSEKKPQSKKSSKENHLRSLRAGIHMGPVLSWRSPSVVLARDISHPHGDEMLVHGPDIYYGISVPRALEP